MWSTFVHKSLLLDSIEGYYNQKYFQFLTYKKIPKLAFGDLLFGFLIEIQCCLRLSKVTNEPPIQTCCA